MRRAARDALIVLLAIPLAMAVAACAGHRIPTATDADAARVSAQWPGTTKEELNHGRKLLLGHCGSCHQPPTPGQKNAAEWGPQVDEMASRAGLSSGDAALVEKYLSAFAKDRDVATAR